MDTAVEYAVDHLGVSMAATTPEVVKTALRRRCKAQLSMAAWRGLYANLILDRTKYVGTGVLGTIRTKTRQDMRDRADACEHTGVRAASETDMPTRDAFPTDWGNNRGDALD